GYNRKRLQGVEGHPGSTCEWESLVMLSTIFAYAGLQIVTPGSAVQQNLSRLLTARLTRLALALVQVSPQITLARGALEGEIASVTIGAFLFALSLATAGLAALRRKSRDPILIYFPIFCGLYGIRLLATTPIVHFLIPAPAPFWSYLSAFI